MTTVSMLLKSWAMPLARALARDRLPPEEPAREELAEILRAAEHGASLTQQLLVFGRREGVEAEPIDLNAVVHDLVRLLRRTIGENIDLDVNVEPMLAHVLATPSELEQIVLNLAINARDAMPTGGRLRIETGTVSPKPEWAFEDPEAGPGPYARLRVADDGVGMPREVDARARSSRSSRPSRDREPA